MKKTSLIIILAIANLGAIAQTMVQNINPGAGSSNPDYITSFGADLYFVATDGTNGQELWKYDGTTATLVQDINPGSAASYPSNFYVFNSALYFRATNGTNGYELWKHDGTTTTLVQDINPGVANSAPYGFTLFNSALYFIASEGTNGYELWKFDGTTATLVQNINPGTGDSFPGNLTVFGANLYFTANDGTNGNELWKYDGTTASLVLDINPGAGSSAPGSLTVLGSNLYFTANDGTNGTELWKYNGTTASLIDINPGASGSAPEFLTVLGSNLYFKADDGTNGAELWKYDGTTASLVQNINPGGANSNPENLAVFNSALYFSAFDLTNGAELWKYDGTTATLVKDIFPGADDSEVESLTVAGPNLYFSAYDGTNGIELWKYDGATATLIDINPGGNHSEPYSFIAVGTDLYFGADDGTNGQELWKVQGPVLVTSISVQGQAGATAITTNDGTLQMEATVLPANATNATYTWSVTNGTGNATINTNGLLTAVSNGTVTVTATANDSSGKTGSATITVSNQVVLVTSVTVQGQGGATTITTNDGTLQMEATVLPANATDATYTWSVANGTGNATIDANGLLTAVANGTVTVTATANDASGKTGSAEITISNQIVLVTSLTVQGQGSATAITTNGGTLQMEAIVLPANATDATYTWSVASGTGNATINASGLLTAVANGTVTVTATARDASAKTGSVEVAISNQIVLVSSVAVQGQGGAATIATNGGTLQMEATVLPANASDATYTWSVANGTGSATIDANGLLTAVANGTVTATATANDGSGKTGSAEITISNQVVLVTSLTVQGQAGATTITTNDGTLQMEATVLPADATDGTYTWSVANGTGEATIDANGLLTAVSNGTVTVTATANDASGKTGSAEITISNQVVLVTSITVQGQNGASTIDTNGGTLQMEATVLPADATDATYAWSVTNGTGNATIDANGLLTAVSNGTVTVTATANDASGVAGEAIITISNQFTLGVNDPASLVDFFVYPNPVSSVLSIEFDKAIQTVAIVDVLGRPVKTIFSPGKSLDVSDLSPGNYFLLIRTNSGLISKRFVKQ